MESNEIKRKQLKENIETLHRIRINKQKSTYFSWPAVSHIEMRTALPSTLIFLFKNDA